MKLVYCIIVTYNGIKWVDKCFTSLKSADITLKTIVIDNGSTDGTQDAIKKGYPEVELIQSEINLGFGKANNIGIRKALSNGADYIFLLNQDAYLYKGSFKKLLASFELEQRIGIISPIHLAGDERNLDYGFQKYVRAENAPNLLGDTVLGNLKPLYSANFVNAAAWIIKSEVIKEIGDFHPAFDHYGEDNEFVFRVTKNNYKICIKTDFIIVHDRPQKPIIDKTDKNYVNKFKQIMLLRYFTGELNKRQFNILYIKTIMYNFLKFKMKYSIDSFYCWRDVSLKIKKYKNYQFYI
ncbi:glycosyltransferase family 2 protein [Pontibacter sp. BT731]|uniref:glycosyltransferase n=1 Tax=Pontibacter coccineus TaxID=3063328 RepID=UPI0026E43B1F|nr:glycosyltransferase family 2 protein [Pontibacter sp. BT731]MDO6390232.1 glycosyltransferase family 2 protein [Pontibacter sp. BT731]